MKKEWKNPELLSVEIVNTEHGSIPNEEVDGTYIENGRVHLSYGYDS